MTDPRAPEKKAIYFESAADVFLEDIEPAQIPWFMRVLISSPQVAAKGNPAMRVICDGEATPGFDSVLWAYPVIVERTAS